MNLTDLARANQLANERDQIARAVVGLDNGGRIVGMTITNAPMDPDSPPFPPTIVTVSTGYMLYPPAMISTIRSALEARQREIATELSQLGVSGVS